VLDNVLLPVSLRREPTDDDRARARTLLEQMGLRGHESRYPRQLSGGQQSRVAIARAMVLSPPLLLMDEPFAALDAMTREELQLALQSICVAHNTAVLFVTHDIAEAVFLADRVAVMDRGRIVCDLPIAAPRPRSGQLRYDAAFNAMCATLRQALGGVPS
jgi:NitT/TauT family transport system ATP-binding protein